MTININSSIEDISKEIANCYNFKPFPKKKDKDGYLVYDKKGDPSARGFYGNSSACHQAALVPYITQLYVKHKDSLSAKLQKQLSILDNNELKLLQIVALMRFSGRWHADKLNPEKDDNAAFAEQNYKECFHLLEQSGIDKKQANKFSKLLLEIESNQELDNLDLYASILKDAINVIDEYKNIHSLEDRIDKKVLRKNSPFCLHVTGDNHG